MSKRTILFVAAGLCAASAFMLAIRLSQAPLNSSPVALASPSQDEAAKAATRAMTFTAPKDPAK